MRPLNLFVVLMSSIPLFFVVLYMQSYGRNVPYSDQWHFSSEIAVAAQNGTLSFEQLFRQYNDHRIVFTNVSTAISSLLTNWNTKIEMWLNLVIAFAYFSLLLRMFYHQAPQAFMAALIPISAIVFSLNQQYNWLLGHHTGWHYVVLFTFAAIYLILYTPLSWRSLFAAALMCTFATFSFGSGAISWFLGLGLLWMRPYRNIPQYIFWVFATTICISLYAGESSSSANAPSIQYLNPIDLISFAVALLGNAVTWFDLTAAYVVGTLGILIFSMNLFYLWLPKHDWRIIAPWLGVGGFGMGASLGIALARYNENIQEMALTNRFVGAALPFWFAVVAVMVIVIYALWNHHETAYKKYLLYSNIFFAVLLTFSYLRASAFTLQTANESFRYNHRLAWNSEHKFEEDCMLLFPVMRDLDCFEAITGWIDGGNIDEHTYRLAAYKLAIFHKQPSTQIIERLDDDDRILIDSPSRWLNVYIRDWMLADVNDEQLFHIAPSETALLTDLLPHPLGRNRVETLDDRALVEISDFIEGRSTIWYLFTPETAEHEAMISEALTDYYPTVTLIEDPVYQSSFTLIRFEQEPKEISIKYRFGNDITLQAWNITAERLEPCSEVTVGSWWLSESIPDLNYSATLALVDIEGNKVAQADGQLANIPMQLWQAQQFFFDERNIAIPCELLPGEYHLEYGIYNYETLEELPVDSLQPDLVAKATRAPLLKIDIP